MEQVQPIQAKSKYEQEYKSYYERNRDRIAEKEKQKKRWISYYARNREAVLARVKARAERLRVGKIELVIDAN